MRAGAPPAGPGPGGVSRGSVRGAPGRTRVDSRPVSRSLSRAGAVVAALLLALALAGPALAHAELATSEPADGAALATPPTAVKLTFTEGLDAGKSSFRLLGPAGEVGTAKPARDGAKVMRLEGLTLVPGAYTIRWTAAARDGHVERGTQAFTVLEPAPAPATTSPEAPAPSSEASAAPAGTAAASPAPAAPSPAATAIPATPVPASTPGGAGTDQAPAADSGTDTLIPIVAALALVAAIGVLVLRRSRRA